MSRRDAASQRPRLEVDGILLVDKPSGPTSHDVVARIRRNFGIKKVGHGGTLDPMATGLLVILVGRGTKLSQRIMGSDKTYEGTYHLGVVTESQDIDGAIVEEQDASQVTEEAVREKIAGFLGDQMQTPPMLSAIKQGGVPLYKLARKGKTVEREPRLIHIFDYRVTGFRPPFVDFTLRCTKGTYVRTLAAELGEQLGCGAHLCALRRSESGDLRLADALPLAELLAMSPADLAARVIPPHAPALDGLRPG